MDNIQGTVSHEIKKLASVFSSGRLILVMPVAVLLLALIIFVVPGNEIPEGGSNLRALRVGNFPIVLILEQDRGEVTSGWLRTPRDEADRAA